MNEGYASEGIVRAIDRCADDLDTYMTALVGRKVDYKVGQDLLDALFFAQITIEAAMDKIPEVLNADAVVRQGKAA